LLIGVLMWLGGIPYDDGMATKRLPITLMVWLLGGLAFGVATWFGNESLYKRHATGNADT
ncbi:MAG: hypothetical protein AAGJ55_08205, partial [Cyanobacteria bacterium J06555_12]